MTRSPTATFVRDIDILYQVGTVGGLTDRELLGHFTARDSMAAQQAFEAIVHRHGPMVLAVCRRVLDDEHTAEDAFQATFLVLALKAGAIRKRSSLGPWLHGVAARISRRARALSRHRREQPLAPGSVALCAAVGSEIDAAELRSVLDEEIDRLPAAFRRAVVLCCLEGKTQEDAARELGWTKGTVSGRLGRAKELLRARLTRRGFAPSPMVVGTLLAQNNAKAAVPASLASGAVQQAVGVLLSRAETLAASGAVVALARWVLRAMLLNKLKLTVVTLLFLGILASGAGLLGRSWTMTKDEPKPSRAGVNLGHASRDEKAGPSADADRIVITGRVLGPDGKPVAGAQVAVVAMPQPQPQTRDLREQDRNQVLGSARADALGRFRVDFQRSAPDRSVFRLIVGATGWALAGKEIEPNATSPDQTITLEPERIFRGRFIDLQGQPIPGVRVRVSWYQTLPYETAGEAPPWPGPATTDELGRFTLHGLGADTWITLEATSDRQARQIFRIDPRDEARTREQTFALSPAQVIEVHVTHADDGKPVPHAWVNVLSQSRGNRSQPMRETSARTNEQGLARIIPTVGDSFSISATPPAGEPYLNQRVDINWPKGAVRQSVELKLKRGVPVHGTITEEASGKPVAGALVEYSQTQRDNRLYRGVEGFTPTEAVTGRDGNFQIVIPAGPGHLLVRAATPDYLHLTTNNLELGVSSLPIWLMYPDALAHTDLKPDETLHEITMRLRRGLTVAGRVIGPDGNPVAKAIAFGRTYVPYRGSGAPFISFNGNAPEIKVRDGRFEIPGCDPEKPCTFHFFDREHQFGATVKLAGKSARNGPVIVQLERCGAARVRYKDPQGKPIVGYQPDASRRMQDQLILIITPGTESPVSDRTMADYEFQGNLDTQRLRGLRTDADGRVTMVSLIPDATYRFRGHDFTALAGKTIDLPDVTVPRP
ncbi:MAG: sigma-70 family RNA polymerase sigma factor [Isosphaeraceae bacterium]